MNRQERAEARARRTADRRAATAAQYRAAEDRVLAAAAQLDPADDSPTARQIRETAGSVHDHRTNPTTTTPPA